MSSLAAALAACDGLKEALTAHVDVVARASDQELSVTRLADLLGNAKIPVPITKENASIVTDLWVNYELLAHAAAIGDSLSDRKLIDKAVEPLTKNDRLRKFMDTLQTTFKVDSASESTYNQAEGGLYAARHILFAFPPNATGAQKDSVRKKAESILPAVNNANFSAMAAKYSTDPGSAKQGGSLGVFEKGSMVGPFGNAVAALKPGEISSSLVETQYGFHIIQRLPFSEVKSEYQEKYGTVARNKADSVYLSSLEKNARIEVKSNAPSVVKDAIANPVKYRKSDETLASYKGGDLTVSSFLGWLETFPPQMQVMRQLPQLPDSLVKQFVTSIAQREVMLQKADSAHIKVDTTEQAQLYQQFGQFVQRVQQELGIDPKSLSDSAKTKPERERLAANRVESYLDRILAGQAQPVPVPQPIASVLQDKYESSVNQAGLDRAVERAQKIRTVADSTRAANQPKSAVPLPGAPGGAGSAPGAAPQPSTPAPKPGTAPGTKRP
ncbi:MAG TPA: peptidylprolyl isomerase [Gemmatimonadaceae bacterium]|nr:peptidylprolyl isomerase [Gemmatimonadaceae bacterium]